MDFERLVLTTLVRAGKRQLDATGSLNGLKVDLGDYLDARIDLDMVAGDPHTLDDVRTWVAITLQRHGFKSGDMTGK